MWVLLSPPPGLESQGQSSKAPTQRASSAYMSIAATASKQHRYWSSRTSAFLPALEYAVRCTRNVRTPCGGVSPFESTQTNR